VYIEGKNRTRSYEDKQGVKRYVTEVVGEELILLDKKEG
jgi:single-strand DNA-binding protein